MKKTVPGELPPVSTYKPNDILTRCSELQKFEAFSYFGISVKNLAKHLIDYTSCYRPLQKCYGHGGHLQVMLHIYICLLYLRCEDLKNAGYERSERILSGSGK